MYKAKSNCIKDSVYIDEGISGTNTKKRKEFNRMITCAKNGEFDFIITKEISRFARNTLDSIYYTRELKKYGVGVIFMNDNINTLDSDAELRLTIMSSIAQEESRKTSERVKWGQKRQMEQGVVFGRSMLGYDIKDGKMYVNEEGAEIVRLIFHKFVQEKKGTHTIARELREENLQSMKIRKWSNTTILRIIQNEKYCGDLIQKKTYTPDFLSHKKKINFGQEEFVIIKDHHEPIISRELFDRANCILTAKSFSQEGKNKYSNRYPFSGKIKCARCGVSYVARYKTRKDGSKYKAWRCLEATKNGIPNIDRAGNKIGCVGFSIRNEEVIHIMELVCRQLKIEYNQIIDNLITIIEKVVSIDITEVYALSEKVDAIKKKCTNLIDLYTSGDIDHNEFIFFRAKYNTEIENLKSEMEKQDILRKEIRNRINEEEFYAKLLDKMIIDREKIDVYLNMFPFSWSYIINR